MTSNGYILQFGSDTATLGVSSTDYCTYVMHCPIIVFHPLLFLICRVYRIGQCKDVKVFRLISLGTVEEIIYLRQIYKQVYHSWKTGKCWGTNQFLLTSQKSFAVVFLEVLGLTPSCTIIWYDATYLKKLERMNTIFFKEKNSGIKRVDWLSLLYWVM